MRKKTISELLALGQVVPASQLAKQKADETKRALDYESAVEAEISHRRTKIQSGIAPIKPTFKREKLED